MIRRNFWQTLKKFCTLGSEPPQIFENFTVALNPMYRLFFKLCQKLHLILLIKIRY